MRQRATRPPLAALRERARRFGRDEEGSMLIFGLFIMILMMMVGGMAVDLMRYETNRTRLQATLDRAILASTDLDQTLDAEAVARDYFDAAGLLDKVTSITVTEAMNSRTVAATAQIELDTYFMDLIGVPTLSPPAAGTAEQRVSDIEIVLVLDVTGSMSSNNRIVNLRAAAREFVEVVLADDDEDRVSVAIVPFNAQVNLGAALMAEYNVTNLHGVANSNCLDLPATAYSTPGLSTAAAVPQAGYFDAFTATTRNNSYVGPQGIVHSSANMPCRVEQNVAAQPNLVRLPSQDIERMQAQIQALSANGNTSITLGMKWGLELIDPGSRPMFDALIDDGAIPATLRDRPYDYDREDTLKVIVLMTDGEHVSSRYLENGYRTEVSPIWRAGDGNYSILHNRTGTTFDYWVPHLNIDASSTTPPAPGIPRNGIDDDRDGVVDDGLPGGWLEAPYASSGTTRLNWHQVWTQVRMQWVAWQLYARALGTNDSTRNSAYNTWMGNFTGDTVVNTMNSQLQQSCNLARANDVLVFGIAFEAPAAGQTQIYNCATTPSHFYNANGMQIREVFNTIAGQIQTLRITQ